MNTRGRVGRGNFLFFTFLLFFEKVQTMAEKRESLSKKRKYLFQFPRQREEEKVGKIDRIAKEKEALHCSAYDAIIIIIECVCIHLI